MLNGDIRQPVPVHYESNCCVDSDGIFQRSICTSNFFNAVCNAGVLGTELTDEPSKNRWGSLAEHESEQVSGHCIHDLHTRSMTRAFDHWDAGDPGADEEDDYRAMVKGKVWRSVSCMNDLEYQWQKTCRNWSLASLEHLWMRLQHMGESADFATITDINFPATDPIMDARRTTMQLVYEDVTAGQMRSVHWQYHDRRELQDAMVAYNRHLNVSIDSQVCCYCYLNIVRGSLFFCP